MENGSTESDRFLCQEPHGIHAKKVLFLHRRLPLRSSNQRMITVTRITTELMPVGMGSLRGMSL